MSKITRLVQTRYGGLFELIGDALLSLASETDGARMKRTHDAKAADAAAIKRAAWIRTGFTPSMNRFADGCAPPRPVQ